MPSPGGSIKGSGYSQRKTTDNINLSDIRSGQPVKAGDIHAIAEQSQREHLGRRGFVDQNVHGFFERQVPEGVPIVVKSLSNAPVWSSMRIVGTEGFLCGALVLLARRMDDTLPPAGLVCTNGPFTMSTGNYGWVQFINQNGAKIRIKGKGHAPAGIVPPRL